MAKIAVMESKKDIKAAKKIFIKSISNAALKHNPKLAEILSYIFKELDELFPEEKDSTLN